MACPATLDRMGSETKRPEIIMIKEIKCEKQQDYESDEEVDPNAWTEKDSSFVCSELCEVEMHEVDTSETSLNETGDIVKDESSLTPSDMETNEENRDHPKPTFTYSVLVALALKNSLSGHLTPGEIYGFINRNFPFFRSTQTGWKSSVRHSLTSSKFFKKGFNAGRARNYLWSLKSPKKSEQLDQMIKDQFQMDVQTNLASMAHPSLADKMLIGEMKTKPVIHMSELTNVTPVISTTVQKVDEQPQVDNSNEFVLYTWTEKVQGDGNSEVREVEIHEVDISESTESGEFCEEGTFFSSSDVDKANVENRVYPKPTYTYSALIALALKNSSGHLTPADIYNFTQMNFPFYRTSKSGWKNCVKYSLTLSQFFKKSDSENPRSYLWTFKSFKKFEQVDKLIKEQYKINVEVNLAAMAYPEMLDRMLRGKMKIKKEKDRIEKKMAEQQKDDNTEEDVVWSEMCEVEIHEVGASKTSKNN